MQKTNLHLLFGALLLSAAGTGCAVRARGYAYVETPAVFVEAPTLVAIEHDVYVVRDYDASVYYVGDAYWYHGGGVWYRAGDWNRGWVSVEAHAVPGVIVHRDHHRYVRYHGAANAVVGTSATVRGSAKARPRGHQDRSVRQRAVREPAAHPGYKGERAEPRRRPRYDKPDERQPVRGRDAAKPKRPQKRGHERRDDDHGDGRKGNKGRGHR